jgi:hypothetical protein
MNCKEAQQNLEPALDGAIDVAAQRRLHEHVSNCVPCKEKLAQLEGVRELLRESTSTAPSESLDARVMGSFRRHHADEKESGAGMNRWRDLFLRSLRVPVPIAAMLLIAMVAMVLMAYRTGRQNAQYVVVNPPTRAEPSAAEDVTVKVDKTGQVNEKPLPPAIATIVPASTRRNRRNRSLVGVKNELTEQPIKSSTVVSSDNTSYSTIAVLKGFEPLPIATARIIKGEPR